MISSGPWRLEQQGQSHPEKIYGFRTYRCSNSPYITRLASCLSRNALTISSDEPYFIWASTRGMLRMSRRDEGRRNAGEKARGEEPARACDGQFPALMRGGGGKSPDQRHLYRTGKWFPARVRGSVQILVISHGIQDVDFAPPSEVMLKMAGATLAS